MMHPPPGDRQTAPGTRQAAPAAPQLQALQTGGWQTRVFSVATDSEAYEASVLVMVDAPEAYAAMANSAQFQQVARQTAERLVGPGEPYQVAARVVPRAPLVVLTAQAALSEDAYQLAHDAGRLLVDYARRLGQPGSDNARVLLGTCSPPAVVKRAPDLKPAGAL